MGLRPLVCWGGGFESRGEHGWLSVVSVVHCRIEVAATGRSVIQRSPSECVCVCVSLSVFTSATVTLCTYSEFVERGKRSE